MSVTERLASAYRNELHGAASRWSLIEGPNPEAIRADSEQADLADAYRIHFGKAVGIALSTALLVGHEPACDLLNIPEVLGLRTASMERRVQGHVWAQAEQYRAARDAAAS